MRLSYDNSHYIFATNSIQNIFESNFIFSKGLASAVSKNGVAPTINFEGKSVSVNEKLMFNKLNLRLWPATDLSKLKFSFTAEIAESKGVYSDLSFQGKIDFNSSFKINNLTSLVSNINSLQRISGTLYVQNTEGLNTVLQRDPNGWKMILKSNTPEKIPSFIRNLDIVIVNGI
jgi:hypothetical protein